MKPTMKLMAGNFLTQRCVTLYNSKNDRILARQARVADGFLKRAIGLMGKKSLNPGEGLILTPCGSVHTLFMRFPIDILYVNSTGTICRAQRALKPWSLSLGGRDAAITVELPVGTLARTSTGPGDEIYFTESLGE